MRHIVQQRAQPRRISRVRHSSNDVVVHESGGRRQAQVLQLA